MHYMAPSAIPPPTPKAKAFNVGKHTPLSPEEKAEKARRAREAKTIKKNAESMKATLKREKKMEQEGEVNMYETRKSSPTVSRSVRRKS